MAANQNVNMELGIQTLQEKINRLEADSNKLRKDMNAQLEEYSCCITTAKKLCQDAIKMATVVKNKLANVSDEEIQWKDIKVKLAMTTVRGKIILDVGGEKYTTNVETLTRVKNTYFTVLLSKQWPLQRDPDDKSIFIDRNGKIFAYILEYFRTDIVPSNVWNDETLFNSLLVEADHFNLQDLISKLKHFPNSTLLQSEHKQKLVEFCGKEKQQWKLIYKASDDGFDARIFHSRCDNKYPTMTIIRSSNNHLFGAYTSVPWTSDNTYKIDTTAFLFTLTNPHNIPPTKYLINASKVGNAVYHWGAYGPTFGEGYDIHLASQSNSNRSSYIGFPNSYTDTTKMGNATFTGERNFSTSDIEVFRLA